MFRNKLLGNKKMHVLFLILIIAALFTTGFTSKAAPVLPVKEAEMAVIKNIKVVSEKSLMENSSEIISQTAKKALEESEKKAKEEAERQKKAASEASQKLLASIIFCEAGNQPYEGQVAVGAVVMNRVKSGSYPNSIEEVIYQKGQFGPVSTGWLDKVRNSNGYTDSAMKAAKDALNGADPVGNCLYFDKGGNGMKIGDHYFH